MPKTVIVKNKNTKNTGPFSVYSNVISTTSLLISNVDKADLDKGLSVLVPDDYVNLVIVNTGPCSTVTVITDLSCVLEVKITEVI